MSEQAAHSDEELMRLSCKGDRMAFEKLYDRYFNRLVRFARGYTLDLHRAEDAVQEVFIRIIERPELFDSSRKFSTWVFTVTANSCKNILRNEENRSRLLREVVAPLQNGESSMHHENDHRLLQERIRNIYNTLNEKEKNIYLLRFEQELSIKEISEIINIPEGSVKSGIYYMLKKFNKHLKEFTHGN